jgi:hypothetical protein
MDKAIRESLGMSTAQLARRRLGPVEHSMLLENQQVAAKVRNSRARLEEIIRETNPRLFWD